MGYDGKGQVRIGDDMTAAEAWRRLGADNGVLEAFVDFACEVSVVVARGIDGATAAYVPVETRHRNHILDETMEPAVLPGATAAQAEDIPARIAEAPGTVDAQRAGGGQGGVVREDHG